MGRVRQHERDRRSRVSVCLPNSPARLMSIFNDVTTWLAARSRSTFKPCQMPCRAGNPRKTGDKRADTHGHMAAPRLQTECPPARPPINSSFGRAGNEATVLSVPFLWCFLRVALLAMHPTANCSVRKSQQSRASQRHDTLAPKSKSTVGQQPASSSSFLRISPDEEDSTSTATNLPHR